MSKRVADLEGAELDYWVAKAEGQDPDRNYQRRDADGSVYLLDRLTREEAEAWAEQREGRSTYRYIAPYSELWQYGGPIIERERIFLSPPSDKAGLWFAAAPAPGSTKMEIGQFADKPLVAAMRVYVVIKLGEEVPDAQPSSKADKGSKEG